MPEVQVTAEVYKYDFLVTYLFHSIFSNAQNMWSLIVSKNSVLVNFTEIVKYNYEMSMTIGIIKTWNALYL